MEQNGSVHQMQQRPRHFREFTGIHNPGIKPKENPNKAEQQQDTNHAHTQTHTQNREFRL